MKTHKLHQLIETLLPPLIQTKSDDEIQREAVAIGLYGQRERIEAVGGLIVTGRLSFLACERAGVKPKITDIDKPADLADYVVRRNLPEHLSRIDRACIGVEWKEHAKGITASIRREGNAKGGRSRDKTARDSGGAEETRWFTLAAHLTGATPRAVKDFARLKREAVDVYVAVRVRRLHSKRTKKDAFELADVLKSPEAREDVIKRHEKNRTVDIRKLIHDVRREREPRKPASEITVTGGEHWRMLSGRMEDESSKLKDNYFEFIHGDIVYGAPAVDMAREIAKIGKRVLKHGGVIALLSGNERVHDVTAAVIAEGFRHITTGVMYLPGAKKRIPGAGLANSIPLLYFVRKGEPLIKEIDGGFSVVSPLPDKGLGGWQKSLPATLDLIKSIAFPGSHGLDPCAGFGTTLHAGLLHGCEMTGIEVLPERVDITCDRLAACEREQAATKLAAIVRKANAPEARNVPKRPPLAKAKPRGPMTTTLVADGRVSA